MSDTASTLRCRACGGELSSNFLYTADNFAYHHECFPQAPQDARTADLERHLVEVREVLERALDAINATEQLHVIEKGGYGRPKEEERLHRIIDEFLDLRRAALDTVKGAEK